MDENTIKINENNQENPQANEGNNLIPVSDFVEKYKNLMSDKAKELYLKSIIKDEYVSYLVKQFWARQIITGSNFDTNGQVYFDGIKQYLSYIYAVLSLYTNLDIPSENFNFYFDMLNELGVIDKLETILPEDFKEFQVVYKIAEDDFRINYALTHINTEDISVQVEAGILNGINKVTELILKTMQDESFITELQNIINQNQDK